MRFKLRVWKAGDSYVMTVPIALIRNGTLHPGQDVWVDIEFENAEVNDND